MTERETPRGEELLPIDRAPHRVQREYYRAERRRSVLAACVVLVVALLGAGGYQLGSWLAKR